MGLGWSGFICFSAIILLFLGSNLYFVQKCRIQSGSYESLCISKVRTGDPHIMIRGRWAQVEGH
jgi:hypothetical protein